MTLGCCQGWVSSPSNGGQCWLKPPSTKDSNLCQPWKDPPLVCFYAPMRVSYLVSVFRSLALQPHMSQSVSCKIMFSRVAMTNVDVWLSMANRVEYLRAVKGCILDHGYIHHQLIRVQARGASCQSEEMSHPANECLTHSLEIDLQR